MNERPYEKEKIQGNCQDKHDHGLQKSTLNQLPETGYEKARQRSNDITCRSLTCHIASPMQEFWTIGYSSMSACFWQRGQKCVPRCPTTMRRMGVAQRVQG